MSERLEEMPQVSVVVVWLAGFGEVSSNEERTFLGGTKTYFLSLDSVTNW